MWVVADDRDSSCTGYLERVPVGLQHEGPVVSFLLVLSLLHAQTRMGTDVQTFPRARWDPEGLHGRTGQIAGEMIEVGEAYLEGSQRPR